jgi:hypothetical protein
MMFLGIGKEQHQPRAIEATHPQQQHPPIGGRFEFACEHAAAGHYLTRRDGGFSDLSYFFRGTPLTWLFTEYIRYLTLPFLLDV